MRVGKLPRPWPEGPEPSKNRSAATDVCNILAPKWEIARAVEVDFAPGNEPATLHDKSWKGATILQSDIDDVVVHLHFRPNVRNQIFRYLNCRHGRDGSVVSGWRGWGGSWPHPATATAATTGGGRPG